MSGCEYSARVAKSDCSLVLTQLGGFVFKFSCVGKAGALKIWTIVLLSFLGKIQRCGADRGGSKEIREALLSQVGFQAPLEEGSCLV
jgi:hypothetical protein